MKPSRHWPHGCRCCDTLCGSRRCTCGAVVIPPRKKYNLLPSGAKQKLQSHKVGSLVEGSVVLVSAYKVAAPNVEGSGLTEMGRGQWRWWKCRQRPRPQKCSPGIISILLEQNNKVLHRNCTTHGDSRRRTQSTLFIVRVEGLGPGWCAGLTAWVGGGPCWSGMDGK